MQFLIFGEGPPKPKNVFLTGPLLKCIIKKTGKGQANMKPLDWRGIHRLRGDIKKVSCYSLATYTANL